MSEYTIDEASRLSGITVRSLRNYVHQYQDFLSLKRGAYNALIFDDESLETLVKIKSLIRDGKTRRQIRETLEREKEEPSIQVTKNALAAPASPEAPVILPLLKKVDDVLTRLLEDNKRLHERIHELEAQVVRQRAVAALPERPQSRLLSGGIPVPYFLLAFKDGCVAAARSFWSTFLGGSRR